MSHLNSAIFRTCLLDHWPALTTPLPCISIINLIGLVKASSDAKKKDCASFFLISTCQFYDTIIINTSPYWNKMSLQMCL